MIDEIVGQAKNNQNGSFKGNQFKKVVLAPDEADTKTGRTNEKLAELANTRLFHHGLFFFSSPPPLHQNNEIVLGNGYGSCFQMYRDFEKLFSLYKCLTIKAYPILKL